MVRNFIWSCISSAFILLPVHLLAQQEKEELKVMKSSSSDVLVELPEAKTSITGEKEILVRDAPATVTVLTEEDILRSGSRDLMDVLRLVPGFEFGTDVEGVSCLGIRGNSANEGGVLVLVDGMEMTEILFASNNFGGIYPIDQIRKIEVIRGPGSVLYGGFAVYAVINIITKATEEFNGFKVSNMVGQTANGSFRKNYSASFGVMYDKINFSLTAGANSSNRSDGFYQDTSSKKLNMAEGSAQNDRFISFRLKAGDFRLKALANFFEIQNQTAYGSPTSKPYLIKFSNLNVDTRYDFNIRRKFLLSPYFNVRQQSPWQITRLIDTADAALIAPFHAHATRLSTGLNGDWKVSDNFDLMGNAGFWQEQAHDQINPDSGLNGTFQCISSFLQAVWRNRFFNLSAGLRFDNHSYYSPIVSPRLAITKPFGNHYLKFSFNRSFRTPAIANMIYSLNGKILPQLTNYYDLEYGAKLGKRFNVALNLYEISVQNAILYQVINGIGDGYSNGGRLGTRGAELQLAFHNESGFQANASWSFYTNNRTVPEGNYAVPGTRINLAYPAHKIAINAGFPLMERLLLNTTVLYLSDRYGYKELPEQPVYLNFGSVLQWNLSIDWRDVYLKGLNLGFGIFDITNSRYSLIQPYTAQHLPVPMLTREFTFRVSYGLNLPGN